MPVVKFPGVTERLMKKLEISPEGYSRELRAMLTGEIKLPQRSPEEEAAYAEQLDEQFYYEDAAEAITHSFILLSDYRKAKIKEFGENSAELSAVKDDIASIRAALRKIEYDLDNPDVKVAIKSLRDIWSEYKGGYYDEKGQLNWRNKPVGDEIIPSLRRTVTFDI